MELPKQSSLAVAKGLNVDLDLVEAIREGYNYQIRYLDDLALAQGLLPTIYKVATEYGVRKPTELHVLEECAEIVMTKFFKLGIPEIREAFRAFAAGEFEAKGADPYGGQLSALMFGRVLGGYTKYRDQIKSHLIQYRDAFQERKRQEAIRSERIETAKKQWPVKMIRYAEDPERYPDWRSLHAFDYSFAVKHGFMPEPTLDQKREIWQEIEEYVEQFGFPAIGDEEDDPRELRRLIKKVISPEDRKAKMKAMAERLALWRFYFADLRKQVSEMQESN